MTRNNGSASITIGALAGTPESWVGPGNASSSGTTYNVGGNNRDATFSGIIKTTAPRHSLKPAPANGRLPPRIPGAVASPSMAALSSRTTTAAAPSVRARFS
jgi:hypothetical protein